MIAVASIHLRLLLAERLRRAMDRYGWSATELALQIDVHPNSIYRLLRGQGLPQVVQLCALADVLGVTTDWLLGRRPRRRGRAPA